MKRIVFLLTALAALSRVFPENLSVNGGSFFRRPLLGYSGKAVNDFVELNPLFFREGSDFLNLPFYVSEAGEEAESRSNGTVENNNAVGWGAAFLLFGGMLVGGAAINSPPSPPGYERYVDDKFERMWEEEKRYKRIWGDYDGF